MTDKSIPAFPTSLDHMSQDGYYSGRFEYGMTLRDYFAGQFLAAYPDNVFPGDERKIADHCYDMAEAMLKRREE